MACDERCRLWAMQQAQPPPSPEMRRAHIVRATPCAARPGFRELHFDVEGTPWSWCFPPTTDQPGLPAHAMLTFRPGPHGLIAEVFTARAPSSSAGQAAQSDHAARLDLGSAADLVMSAADVFVHGSLLDLTVITEALTVTEQSPLTREADAQ
jgi:hypothetical protein